MSAGSAPRVGIFWFIKEPGHLPELLAVWVPLQEGEAYGIYVNGPEDHVWNSVKPRLALLFHDCGPKDWPRGRVLFNTEAKRFEAYLDETLQTAPG